MSDDERECTSEGEALLGSLPVRHSMFLEGGRTEADDSSPRVRPISS
jgi:hypothetical protein